MTTTLINAITSSQTTITVLNCLFPSQPGVVTIGSEQIHYTTCGPNNLYNCTRAYNSTSAAAHAANATVTLTSTDDNAGTADLVGTAPVTVVGGTAVLPSTVTLSMHVADSTHDGYLSSANFLKYVSWLGVLAADPGSPTEGQVWYNSTTHLLKYQDNAGTKVVATV